MIIAGEASGDLHGAHLVEAMHKIRPSLTFAGIGGPALRQAGVRICFEAQRLAVVGITEVGSKWRDIRQGMAVAKRLLKTYAPRLLILIDFPEFNLHLAATAKRLGVPVLYYISPQIWAWRSGRVRKIRKRVDHMAVILPFEEKFYHAHKVPVTFVGHPLMDRAVSPESARWPAQAGGAPLIGLLPGSRDGEVGRHLPLMLQATEILAARDKNLRFAVSCAAGVDRRRIEALIERHPASTGIEIATDGAANLARRCRLVVAVSGTVTLECAIVGIPMVVIYRVSGLSYLLGKALINVSFISLVNLIAGRRIVPELVQHDASPAKIAGTVWDLLQKPDRLDRTRAELLRVRELLGMPGAAERVADIALELVSNR